MANIDLLGLDREQVNTGYGGGEQPCGGSEYDPSKGTPGEDWGGSGFGNGPDYNPYASGAAQLLNSPAANPNFTGFGAVTGLIRGAAVGFVASEATLGEFTFGLSGLGGASFGGVVGTIADAGGGVVKGFALAEACHAVGVY